MQRSIKTPVTDFSVVYGVSDNDRAPVDNAKASFLEYCPRENAEQFAQSILTEAEPMDSQDAGNMCHGGPFASVALDNSRVATTNIIDDTKKP